MDKTGGPVFPTTQYNSGIAPTGHSEGLSLRDYFAAKAMQGVLASHTDPRTCAALANLAYACADAMLEARDK